MNSFDRNSFKNKTLIFCVIHYNYECVKVTLNNILNIISKNDDIYMVLIDSKSQPNIKELFNQVNHPRVDKVSLPINFGYNHSINFYIRDFINNANLPKTIISLGADILFSEEDFLKLNDAIQNLPQFGVIGMSYFKNECNPEMNTFFKPKNYTGTNNQIYSIKRPFLVPVAGGIMGLQGRVLKDDLNYQLFQPKHFPKIFMKISPVGGADSALYNALKWRYKMGYLANTTAYHLKSRDNKVVDIPSKFKRLLNSPVKVT